MADIYSQIFTYHTTPYHPHMHHDPSPMLPLGHEHYITPSSIYWQNAKIEAATSPLTYIFWLTGVLMWFLSAYTRVLQVHVVPCCSCAPTAHGAPNSDAYTSPGVYVVHFASAAYCCWCVCCCPYWIQPWMCMLPIRFLMPTVPMVALLHQLHMPPMLLMLHMLLLMYMLPGDGFD